MRFQEGQTIDIENGAIKVERVTKGSITARITADAEVIRSLDRNVKLEEGNAGMNKIDGYEYHYEIITSSDAITEMEFRMSKDAFEGMLGENGVI